MKLYVIKYWLFYIWLALIVYASITPNSNMPDMHFFPHFDKVVHFCMYMGLSFLMITIIPKNEILIKPNIMAFSISSIIGGLFELVQKYLTFDRSASWLDFMANSLGAFVGILLYKLLINKKNIEDAIFKN